MAAEYRKRVVVSGSVQGVGFRFFTCRLAESYDVTGYVKNLSGGRVEIVAEGSREEVDTFLRHASQGPTSARVTETKSFEEFPVGGFGSFGVSY